MFVAFAIFQSSGEFCTLKGWGKNGPTAWAFMKQLQIVFVFFLCDALQMVHNVGKVKVGGLIIIMSSVYAYIMLTKNNETIHFEGVSSCLLYIANDLEMIEAIRDDSTEI